VVKQHRPHQDPAGWRAGCGGRPRRQIQIQIHLSYEERSEKVLQTRGVVSLDTRDLIKGVITALHLPIKRDARVYFG
jgi:GH24 family phage-related lysozyme (muramidase)